MHRAFFALHRRLKIPRRSIAGRTRAAFDRVHCVFRLRRAGGRELQRLNDAFFGSRSHDHAQEETAYFRERCCSWRHGGSLARDIWHQSLPRLLTRAERRGKETVFSAIVILLLHGSTVLLTRLLSYSSRVGDIRESETKIEEYILLLFLKYFMLQGSVKNS